MEIVSYSVIRSDFDCIQCAAHLNLGWRITVMDPDPVPTTDTQPVNTQAETDEDIIIGGPTASTMDDIDEFTTDGEIASTVDEIGEFTTDDGEQGIGAVFGRVSTSGGRTACVFLMSLIIAATLAILTSVF